MLMIASIVVVHNVWWCTITFFLNDIFNALDLNASVSRNDRIYFNVAIFYYIQLSTSTAIIGNCISLVLRSLNTSLENALQKPGNLPYFDVIRRTSLIYIKVCEILSNSSIVFTFLFPPFLMIFVFYNLLLTYGLYVYQMCPNNQLFLFSLLAFFFVCLYAPTALIFFSVSSLISSQSQTAIDLVQQIVAKQSNLVVQKKCNDLVLILEHTKPVWSCMMFDIHWKSFFSMLGVIFSYSVILVQFYDVTNE